MNGNRPLTAETLDEEAFWLLCGLLACGGLIVGCALYSLRITKIRLRHTASGRLEGRDKQSTTLAMDDSNFRYVMEGSCELDNPSSVDMTSSSAK
ncbi:hypothetical protein DdX_15353 [Ditylenchus destructor]|uniref:Uncharacterized protein n=1 Tax=Ditylenchus destructor TaxID=166010 RepID=A0AAD4QUU9_9BILA|nr:hypothetical protein DdX_15353 [Ditylenchus destructor]